VKRRIHIGEERLEELVWQGIVQYGKSELSSNSMERDGEKLNNLPRLKLFYDLRVQHSVLRWCSLDDNHRCVLTPNSG
jgi:hypothetical protein